MASMDSGNAFRADRQDHGEEVPSAEGCVRLVTDQIEVACRPAHGFVVTSFLDRKTGADALWTRRGFEPATCTRSLGPAGEYSLTSFDDIFVGGWFLMAPSALLPGELQGRPTLMHGEAARLPWRVVAQDARRIQCKVSLLRSPFDVVRTLSVEGSVLTVETSIANTSSEVALMTVGEHPCLDRETFRGGSVSVAVKRATVPLPPADNPCATLRPGNDVAWPVATAIVGPDRDVSLIPDQADGRLDHIEIAPRDGRVTITAPDYGATLALEYDQESLPHLLYWMNYHAPDASWGGSGDVFAFEPVSAGGLSPTDADRLGQISKLAPGDCWKHWVKLSWTGH